MRSRLAKLGAGTYQVGRIMRSSKLDRADGLAGDNDVLRLADGVVAVTLGYRPTTSCIINDKSMII